MIFFIFYIYILLEMINMYINYFNDDNIVFRYGIIAIWMVANRHSYVRTARYSAK